MNFGLVKIGSSFSFLVHLYSKDCIRFLRLPLFLLKCEDFLPQTDNFEISYASA